MSQNEKEHLLTATLADSEVRCRQEFDRWYGVDGPKRPVLDLMAWNAWRAAWNFLRRETEEWAKR